MLSPLAIRALLAIAVVLMLAGAVTLVGSWLSAAIAIPIITVGIVLVVIAQTGGGRRPARHV